MLLSQSTMLDFWEQSRKQLNTQLEQRPATAVYLEGSIAEGFGNDRSDVDFVAMIDDSLEVPTMPYILFIDGRRIEVRLLSSARLRRELAQVRKAMDGRGSTLARLSWNLLERCQRFMACVPLDNEPFIRTMQDELGQQAIEEAVSGWFADFARQSGRYAVAMLVLEQPDYSRAWIKTAVFHAAKSYVAGLREKYMGVKWLSLQLERARVDTRIVTRLWGFLHDSHETRETREYLERGVALIRDFGVSGVSMSQQKILIGKRRGVTTWQVGERVHLLRDTDIYALDADAASVWRRIAWDMPCLSITGNGGDELGSRRLALLADFSRAGLITLRWKGGGEIRARQHPTAVPAQCVPLISIDGARLDHASNEKFQLLPMPAQRFVEAGLEMAWAHIGLENAREDALGALQSGQWRVLEYSLQRMLQIGCLLALSGHGITPQPPLEEGILDAIRLLRLEDDLVQSMRRLERTSITLENEAQSQLQLTEDIVGRLRDIAGEAQFPASFDSSTGWLQTILQSYDWINLAAHLNARFPQTAHGGRGCAEEARDLLASHCA